MLVIAFSLEASLSGDVLLINTDSRCGVINM